MKIKIGIGSIITISDSLPYFHILAMLPWCDSVYCGLKVLAFLREATHSFLQGIFTRQRAVPFFFLHYASL